MTWAPLDTWSPRTVVYTLTGRAITAVTITGPPVITPNLEPRAARASRLMDCPAFRAPFNELANVVGTRVSAAIAAAESRTTAALGIGDAGGASGAGGAAGASGATGGAADAGDAGGAVGAVGAVGAGGGAAVRAVLARCYKRYEDYDRLTLPLTAATGGGEMVPVDVIRISPDDATSLVDTATGGRKVAGATVHHFGGFLDAGWRRNDIMWGRLDAAERLITAVLSESNPRRAYLIEEAQRAIIADEMKASPELGAAISAVLLEQVGRTSPEGALKALADDPLQVSVLVEEAVRSGMQPERLRRYLHDDFQVPEALEPTASLRTLARGTRVTGQVLSGLAEDQRLLSRPAALMVRAGTFLWGLVEVSVPRSLPALLFRYWLSLLTLIEIILIVGGALLGQPGAQRLGWTALFLTLAARVVVAITAGWLQGKKRPIRLAIGLLLAAILALAFVEAAFHLNDDIQEQLCKAPDAVRKLTSVECPPELPDFATASISIRLP